MILIRLSSVLVSFCNGIVNSDHVWCCLNSLCQSYFKLSFICGVSVITLPVPCNGMMENPVIKLHRYRTSQVWEQPVWDVKTIEGWTFQHICSTTSHIYRFRQTWPCVCYSTRDSCQHFKRLRNNRLIDLGWDFESLLYKTSHILKSVQDFFTMRMSIMMKIQSHWC